MNRSRTALDGRFRNLILFSAVSSLLPNHHDYCQRMEPSGLLFEITIIIWFWANCKPTSEVAILVASFRGGFGGVAKQFSQ